MSLSDLLAVPGPEPRKPKRQTHPRGWEPGVVWTPGEGGTITTGPMEAEPDGGVWQHLIADWGLDPATTEVVPGTVQVRGWDAADGQGGTQRMLYYRATLRPRADTADRADVDALCAEIMKRRPRKQSPAVETDRALVVCLSDWQLGKGEADGTAGTVNRILSATDALVTRIAELRRAGRAPSSIYLVGLGDLVEQCDGHYAMQAFQADLDRREQMRVARRLILHIVDAVTPLTQRVVLAAVPGNHGENRRNGKAITTWTDNDDLAVVEQVAEILSANPERYGHVSTVLADDLTLTLDVCGVPVAFAHGHQARGGSGHAAAKLEAWWKGQALGRTGVADAQILITGHLHHLVLSEATGRTFMQCPAMDPGSHWWTAATGSHSPAGLLTIGVGDSYGPRGWGDLAVIGGGEQ